MRIAYLNSTTEINKYLNTVNKHIAHTCDAISDYVNTGNIIYHIKPDNPLSHLSKFKDIGNTPRKKPVT